MEPYTYTTYLPAQARWICTGHHSQQGWNGCKGFPWFLNDQLSVDITRWITSWRQRFNRLLLIGTATGLYTNGCWVGFSLTMHTGLSSWGRFRHQHGRSPSIRRVKRRKQVVFGLQKAFTEVSSYISVSGTDHVSTFRVFKVIGKAVCCPIWFSRQTLEAAEWSGHPRFISALNVFPDLPLLLSTHLCGSMPL